MSTECRIAVALPPLLERQLRAAGYAEQLAPIASPCDGRIPQADVLVLDPVLCVAPDADGALASRASELEVPCVFYTTSAQRALHAVVAMGHLDPVRVLLSGVDDTPPQIRAAIDEAVLRGDVARLRRALAGALHELPPTLQFALDMALRRPEQFFDAADVARHAGFSRRHVDRVLHDHRLAPAKQWVIASRVWHAQHLQQKRRMTTVDTAARLGYADPKALRRHRESVLGQEVSAIRHDSRATLQSIHRYLTTYPVEATQA